MRVSDLLGSDVIVVVAALDVRGEYWIGVGSISLLYSLRITLLAYRQE